MGLFYYMPVVVDLHVDVGSLVGLTIKGDLILGGVLDGVGIQIHVGPVSRGGIEHHVTILVGTVTEVGTVIKVLADDDVAGSCEDAGGHDGTQHQNSSQHGNDFTHVHYLISS